jgi:hypothetical protein
LLLSIFVTRYANRAGSPAAPPRWRFVLDLRLTQDSSTREPSVTTRVHLTSTQAARLAAPEDPARAGDCNSLNTLNTLTGALVVCILVEHRFEDPLFGVHCLKVEVGQMWELAALPGTHVLESGR